MGFQDKDLDNGQRLCGMHAQLSPASGWTTGPMFQWDGRSSESLDSCPVQQESVLQADCGRKVSGSSGGGGNGDHVLKLSSQGLFSSASSQGFHSFSPRSPQGL